MSIQEKLIAIQSELKATKNQYNKFGKYYYRNCEDILEAVKPLCKKQGLVLTITDDIVEVGSRLYVKSTASIQDDTSGCQVSAFAREAEDKKGMDDAQITGAASSYARKYALNGLFLIDDTKDADSQDNTAKKTTPKPNVIVNPITTEEYDKWKSKAIDCSDKEAFRTEILTVWANLTLDQQNEITSILS